MIATQLLRDIVQRHAETDGHALAAIAGQVLPRWTRWSSCPPPADSGATDTLPPSRLPREEAGMRDPVPDRTTGAAGLFTPGGTDE